MKTTVALALCLGLASACPAGASDACDPHYADIQQVEREVADYVASKGETLPIFADRVGNSPKGVIAFVLDTEKCGGTAVGALRSMERSAQAMIEPAQRHILQCFGVPLTDNSNAVIPTPKECNSILERLGLSQGQMRTH